MVLYIFEVSNTQFIKMGFTSGCPWNRIRDGFWKQVHPEQCCGKLGWDDLQLIHMSPGTLENEAFIKEQIPPEKGEFWPRERLDSLLLMMKVLAIGEHNCSNEDWELPLPPRPPDLRQDTEKRSLNAVEASSCLATGAARCSSSGFAFRLTSERAVQQVLRRDLLAAFVDSVSLSGI